MEYQFLGNTGLRIGSIGLGTQTFGWNIGERESKRLLSIFRDAGGNYFDTADSYNRGESERILGAWVSEQGNRDACVIGTKVFFPTGEGPNDSGAGRKHLFQSVEESLERLGTDYIDLYQIHCFDKRTPLEETLRALDDLVRSGKVRYIGASNFTPSQLMKANLTARYEGWSPFSSLQLEYSLLVRSPEWELLPVCEELGVGTLAWSPLAGGWLTGKYRREADVPADSRVGRKDRWDDSADQRGTEKAYTVIDMLLSISENSVRPVSQVSINWLIQQGRITAPLIGARTEAQLRENLGALEWTLTDVQLEKLAMASAIEEPSPYSFIHHYTRK